MACSCRAGKAPACGTNSAGTVIEIPAEAFGLPLAQDDIARQYAKGSVLLQAGERPIQRPHSGWQKGVTLWFEAAASPLR